MIDWYFENTDYVGQFMGPFFLICCAFFLFHKDLLLERIAQNKNTVGSLWRRGSRCIVIGILILIIVKADPSIEPYRNLYFGGFGLLMLVTGAWILARLPHLVGRPAINVNVRNVGLLAWVLLVSSSFTTYILWVAPIIFG